MIVTKLIIVAVCPMPQPPIYVISLATAHERRAFITQQFEAIKLPFEFFDGVHGASNPDHPLFQKYDDQERLRRRGPGVSLNLGQLGCFASHYLLWEKCVELGTPIILLEDDALLIEPAFTNFYDNAHYFADAYGLVWMQPELSKQRRDITLENSRGFVFKKFLKGATGTTGYLINPDTAQILLNYCQTWIYPVDTTMKRFFEHGVEAIGIDPVCIRPQDGLGSFINSGKKVKRTLLQKLRREFFTTSDKFKRGIHNTLFRLQKGRKLRNSNI